MAHTVDLPNFKRGDTFRIEAVFRVDGAPTDLTGWNVECQLRDRDDTAIEMQIDLAVQADNPGQFLISPDGDDTSAWPLQRLRGDIQFTNPDGVVASTVTFIVPVVEDITR
jgi:hypothetical protein